MSQINCYKRGVSPPLQHDFDREETAESPLVQQLDGKYPKISTTYAIRYLP